MKNKSNIKTITQALTSKLPSEEDYFKERLKICEPCEHNTDNIPRENLTTWRKKQIDNVCKKNRACNACGCCLDEKIGKKETECGLVKLGLEPKWKAILAESASVSDLNVEILDRSADSVKIDTVNNRFVIDLGDRSGSTTKVSLLITKKKGLSVTNISASCSCTVPVAEQVDPNSVKLVAKLNLNSGSFIINKESTKNVTVTYYINNKETRKSTLQLKVKKING